MPALIEDGITREDIQYFASWAAPEERYREAERRYLASNPNRHAFTFNQYVRERDLIEMLENPPHDPTPLGRAYSDSDRRREVEHYEKLDARPYNPFGPPRTGAHEQYGPPAAHSTTSQSNIDARGHGTGQSHQSRHEYESNDRAEGSISRHGESRSRPHGERRGTRDSGH